jgi:8-oxo-dGTP pyrophosphatase MutT (NUDIX family)
VHQRMTLRELMEETGLKHGDNPIVPRVARLL